MDVADDSQPEHFCFVTKLPFQSLLRAGGGT